MSEPTADRLCRTRHGRATACHVCRGHVSEVRAAEDSAKLDATALRLAADALEAQPPKLRAQYVATLRLYADEPWRLAGSAPDPRTHGLNHAPLADGSLLAPGFCARCDDDRDTALANATPTEPEEGDDE